MSGWEGGRVGERGDRRECRGICIWVLSRDLA